MSEVIYIITTLASGQRHFNQFLRDQLAKLVELNETALVFSRKETFCKETQTVIIRSQAVTAETQTTPQAMPHANREHRGNSHRIATPKRPRDLAAEQRLTPPKKSKSRLAESEQQKQGSLRASLKMQLRIRQKNQSNKGRLGSQGQMPLEFQELGICKAANGDLLLRLTKQPAHSTGELQETVRKALGEKPVVRTLTDQTRVEIRDLDELTTKEEIIAALNSSMDVTSFDTESIKSLRATKDGLQLAVLSLPTSQAN
ncbi:hypothetical protein ACLKA6_010134 [Drosophila palustris]